MSAINTHTIFRGRSSRVRLAVLCGWFLVFSSALSPAQQNTGDSCLKSVREAYRKTAEDFSADTPYRFQCRYRAVQLRGRTPDTVDTFMEMISFRGVSRYTVGDITTFRDPVSVFVVYRQEKLIYAIGFDSLKGTAEGSISMFRDTLLDHLHLQSCVDTLGPSREPLKVVVAIPDTPASFAYNVSRLTFSLRKGTGDFEGMTLEYLPGHNPMRIELSRIITDYAYQQIEFPESAAAFIFDENGALRPEYSLYTVVDQRKKPFPITNAVRPEEP